MKDNFYEKTRYSRKLYYYFQALVTATVMCIYKSTSTSPVLGSNTISWHSCLSNRRQRKGPMTILFLTREKGTPNKSTLKVEKGKKAIAGSQEMLLGFEGQDAGGEKWEQKRSGLNLRMLRRSVSGCWWNETRETKKVGCDSIFPSSCGAGDGTMTSNMLCSSSTPPPPPSYIPSLFPFFTPRTIGINFKMFGKCQVTQAAKLFVFLGKQGICVIARLEKGG